MSTASDRRAAGATRIPFDAMVEVGGALGPSFEARAVNVSGEGMQLRTPYLPEVGQTITCRFEPGSGGTILAEGEVVWADDMGDGGEFGIRFVNLDGPSSVALKRALGIDDEHQGRKVRMHIEGLASPMRARVKSADGANVTAFSELGFLQVGKPLELEDSSTGERRPALIHGVSVEIDGGSRIPQLVVTLRYDDEQARAILASGTGTRDARAVLGEAGMAERSPSDHDASEDEAVDVGIPSLSASATVDEDESLGTNAKNVFARSAAKVSPTVQRWAKSARGKIAALASSRAKGPPDGETPLRRTTAPAPGGGLHTAGRKVVRGEFDRGEEPERRAWLTKKRAGVASVIVLAGVLGFVALRASPETTAPSANAVTPPPAEAVAAPKLATPDAPEPLDPGVVATAEDPFASMVTTPERPQKKGRPAPFGNGPLGMHPNVLRLKMDGHVDKILGASQPTGFTVVLPGRKSLDAAAPLAAQDPRIAAIQVANEASGAELSVAFKDGVPNYQVRGRGDAIELVLARPGSHGAKAPEAKAPTKSAPKKRRQHH